MSTMGRLLVTPGDRLYPSSAIVPIHRIDAKTGQDKELLGTGFFIGEQGTLMSVRHVLGVQLGAGEAMAIQLTPPGGGRGWLYRIENVRVSQDYDLAIADVPDADQFQAVGISVADPEGMPELWTHDYSTGPRSGWLPDGSQGLRLVPYTWQGVWLATYVAHEPGMPKPARIIDVPFPVMRGASGSPVLIKGTRKVVGILFGNVARQLMPPPQLQAEGHPWYLPVGQALHCAHIREFLESIASGGRG